jgi:hypothetical protein
MTGLGDRLAGQLPRPQDAGEQELKEARELLASFRGLGKRLSQAYGRFPVCCWRNCTNAATVRLGVWELRGPGGDYDDPSKIVCDKHAAREDAQRHRVDLPQATLLREIDRALGAG